MPSPFITSDSPSSASNPESPLATPSPTDTAHNAGQFLHGSGESATDAQGTINEPTNASTADTPITPGSTDRQPSDPKAKEDNTADKPIPHERESTPIPEHPEGEPHMSTPDARYAPGHIYMMTPERASAEGLTQLTGRGLIEYLQVLHVNHEAIEIIIQTCQDGQEWTQLVFEVSDSCGPEAANTFLQEELKIDNGLTRVKLLVDVKCAVNQDRATLLERDHQRALETHRAANTTYSPTVERNPDGSPKQHDHERSGGQSARVHYAPKIPDYDPIRDLVSGADTFQVFGKSLSSWIEGFEPTLAQAIDDTVGRVGLDTMEGMQDSLTLKARTLDTQLGAHLFSTASKDT